MCTAAFTHRDRGHNGHSQGQLVVGAVSVDRSHSIRLAYSQRVSNATEAEATRKLTWPAIIRLFRTAPPASPGDITANLWNASVTSESYTGDAEKYQSAILEQYKLCVEMADRISARRALANGFFLTLNTAVLTTIGVFLGIFWKDRPNVPVFSLVLPLVLLLVLCLAWFWLVRSYRQLNSGKYAVIGALEERLPASPYWRAEWTALGEGKDKAIYWPLTHLEQWVPSVFAFMYICGFLVVLLAKPGHFL